TLLRLQASGGPGTGLEQAVWLRREGPRPAGAVVHSPFSFDPQLDRFGPETVAAPIRRTRDDDPRIDVGSRVPGRRRAEALGGRGNRFLQRRARSHRLALGTGPGGDLALPRPGSEIGITVRGGCLRDRAFDAHLPV